jgi:hypothetical protein
MKYLTWFLLVLLTPIRKIAGVFWYWVVVWFRAYARNYVYNYVLQNNIDMCRLSERYPEETSDGWILKDVHNVGYNGYIHKRKVNTFMYWLLVLVVWGWVDDDSNQDTFDAGHNNRYINGDLSDTWQAKLWRKQLAEANNKSTFGNTFDLGDLRAANPDFSFPAALIWNTRNTGYNFQYLWHTTSNKDRVWNVKFWGMEFGWFNIGEFNGNKYYTLIFIKNF